MMRVYRYGLRAPTEGAALVREQMRLAHRYRCTLTEIERGRRAAQRAALGEHGDLPALEMAAKEADEAIERAVRALKAAKAANRTRSVPPDLRAALTAARVAKRDAVALLREARRVQREDAGVVATREAIDATAAALRRNARAHCGVYWGTYLLVEAEDDAARKQPMYDGATPNDPRFPRWTGEGTIGVQIQKGEDAASLVDGEDTRMQIVPVPRTGRTEGRRPKQFAVLRMRVGSQGRAPVWASFPAILHRPMPVGSIVKKAAVHLRKIGPREEWYATITLDVSACEPARTLGPCGAVAVDVGWRVRASDTIRVACWVGEDGGSGEIALDDRTVSGLRLPESLRSQRDRNFDDARAALRAWLDARTDVPAWLTEATRHLAWWRAPGKLAALAIRWRAARWADDAEGYDALERWRYHDRHLWQWESDQREGALRHRREQYRVVAARLGHRYGHLVIEKFDKRVFARLPAPESPETINETARSNRHLVAVSELVGSLRNVFGSLTSEICPVDSTHECAVCGTVDDFDAAARVNHACSACSTVWDQDYNAARVLLARYLRERSGGAPDPVTARGDEIANDSKPPKESRWAKAKRAKVERRAAGATARNPDAKAAE